VRFYVGDRRGETVLLLLLKHFDLFLEVQDNCLGLFILLSVVPNKFGERLVLELYGVLSQCPEMCQKGTYASGHRQSIVCFGYGSEPLGYR
jgi:hypothetical protein